MGPRWETGVKRKSNHDQVGDDGDKEGDEASFTISDAEAWRGRNKRQQREAPTSAVSHGGRKRRRPMRGDDDDRIGEGMKGMNETFSLSKNGCYKD
jgi:hypothetical protein